MKVRVRMDAGARSLPGPDWSWEMDQYLGRMITLREKHPDRPWWRATNTYWWSMEMVENGWAIFYKSL